jgi:hypothetical protein
MDVTLKDVKNKVNNNNVELMLYKIGIKKDKPFCVDNNDFGPYIFDGKFIKDANGNYATCDLVLSICSGESKVIEYTVPMLNKIYFFVTVNGKVDCRTWENHHVDYCFYMAGNVFATKKEAEIHIDEFMEKYKKLKK